MRRAPKPFTVEVRRGGRQSEARSIARQPNWPDLADPLPVSSPEAVVTAPEPIAAPFAGRILPALTLPEPDVDVKPTRRPRISRKSIADETVPEWIGDEPKSAELLEAVVANASLRAEPAVEHSGVRRGRLPRSHFGPGERWKARLPAAVRSKPRPPKV